MPPKSQEKHSANGLSRMSVSELTPDPSNPRKHSKEQIKSIALSIQTFGFTAPILVDKKRKIIAGHGRYEAAKLLNHDHVPVIRLDHLSEDQARAYMLADNKLTDRSSWDDDTLAVHLKELSELAIEFNIEASGFELAEIDLRIQSLDDENVVDEADEFQIRADTPVSALGDMWTLGRHLIFCGNALDDNAYVAMFHDERASAAFTDPPYNVRIDGHATGKGKSKHREFPMASGEMSETEFTDFLSSSLKQICAHTVPGGLIYSCMDWRHLAEIHCPSRKSHPRIPMMQSRQDRCGDNGSGSLDSSW
jgi:hypothetical protein